MPPRVSWISKSRLWRNTPRPNGAGNRATSSRSRKSASSPGNTPGRPVRVSRRVAVRIPGVTPGSRARSAACRRTRHRRPPLHCVPRRRMFPRAVRSGRQDRRPLRKRHPGRLQRNPKPVRGNPANPANIRTVGRGGKRGRRQVFQNDFASQSNFALTGFVTGGVVLILLFGEGEDRPAGIFMGFLAIVVSGAIAGAAALFARNLRRTLIPPANGGS